MKKIFTLLLAAGSVTFVSAQYTAKNDRNNDDYKNQKANEVPKANRNQESDRNQEAVNKSYTGSNNPFDRDSKGYHEQTNGKHVDAGYNSYAFSMKERDAEIERINRSYDYKILAVKRDRFTNANRKAREINLIEKQRNVDIKAVNARYSAKYGKSNGMRDSRNRF